MRNSKIRGNKGSLETMDCLICKFNNYLEFERGLSGSTRNSYCNDIRIFLSTEFKNKSIQIKKFALKDILRFILSYSQTGKTSRAKQMIYSLRSFFRFLKLTDLTDGLPSVASHKRNPPEYLSFEQLLKLLKSCDKRTKTGLRDYAILMLLIQLGLRRSEVSKLILSDFDWDNGEIVIRGKGSISRYPISQELGEALVNYLKKSRPPCSCDSFFIQSYQSRTAITAMAVSAIVCSALKRAGLSPHHKGAHLLRHSFATQLLKQGRSLQEIGLVLRHKDIRTTAIYAHVDFDNLRLFALPWPNLTKESRHE